MKKGGEILSQIWLISWFFNRFAFRHSLRCLMTSLFRRARRGEGGLNSKQIVTS